MIKLLFPMIAYIINGKKFRQPRGLCREDPISDHQFQAQRARVHGPQQKAWIEHGNRQTAHQCRETAGQGKDAI